MKSKWNNEPEHVWILFYGYLVEWEEADEDGVLGFKDNREKGQDELVKEMNCGN